MLRAYIQCSRLPRSCTESMYVYNASLAFLLLALPLLCVISTLFLLLSMFLLLNPPFLLNLQAAALYAQASDFNKTARFYYMKAEDAYFLANAQASPIQQ